MSRTRRFKLPSPATVIASIALLVALGGTSYAAVTLAPRSVGNRELKTGAANSRVLADHSVRGIDLAFGVIRQGAPGPPGPPGLAGATGPSGPSGAAGSSAAGAKWALVRPDGGIVAQSGGISLTAKPASGQYILDFGSSVAGKLIIAASGLANDTSFRGTVSAGPCGGADQNPACSVGNDTNHVRVFTDNPGETATADHSFYIAVFG